jgi:hypothetical protein
MVQRQRLTPSTFRVVYFVLRIKTVAAAGIHLSFSVVRHKDLIAIFKIFRMSSVCFPRTRLSFFLFWGSYI